MLTVHDFKVGMKVKAIASDPKGLIGEVKGLDADGTIAVAFEGFNGHTCFGSLEKRQWVVDVSGGPGNYF